MNLLRHGCRRTPLRGVLPFVNGLVLAACGLLKDPAVHVISSGQTKGGVQASQTLRAVLPELLTKTRPYGLWSVDVAIAPDTQTPWMESRGATIFANEDFVLSLVTAGEPGIQMLEFSLMHELGHILARCESGSGYSGESACSRSSLACEIEADFLAAEFGYGGGGHALLLHLLSTANSCEVQTQLKLRLAALSAANGRPSWRQLLHAPDVRTLLSQCRQEKRTSACEIQRLDSWWARQDDGSAVTAEIASGIPTVYWPWGSKFSLAAAFDYQWVLTAGPVTGPGLGGHYSVDYIVLELASVIGRVGLTFDHIAFPVNIGGTSGSRRYSAALEIKNMLPVAPHFGVELAAGLGPMFRSVADMSTELRLHTRFSVMLDVRLSRRMFVSAGLVIVNAYESLEKVEFRLGITSALSVVL